VPSRQRNSDSTSSKEGQTLRGKGRGGGASAAPAQATPTVKNPANAFNKPSVAVLKKTGESFLQVGGIPISSVRFRIPLQLSLASASLGPNSSLDPWQSKEKEARPRDENRIIQRHYQPVF